ncbi:tissue inhibitor of metalloproteinase domain-containing protein [Ditylenchus destructor]|nr:tissue inhibitor of metalloproteinase domain-containing protein [Ditylenchus destructor]
MLANAGQSQTSLRHFAKQIGVVSHVSVNSNNTTDDGHWLRYDVKHIEVFKSSVDPLPGFVLTPPSSATCGITDLVNNNEYLMAGTVANGNELHIYSCLYIPMKDGEFNDEIGALQWKKVPLAIQQKLSSTTNSTCT